jgi:hypothetical protein
MKKKLDFETVKTGKNKAASYVCQNLIKWAYIDVKIAFTEWREYLKLF